MLCPRLIPCLLVENGALVKTQRFRNGKYVGDPLNAVRIFNEKEVDELVVIDISATLQQREPDYELITALAGECRMPLCYGGGVSHEDQVARIVASGVEKVALSSAAISNPDLVTRAAEKVGGQSVVVVLDAKKRHLSSRYDVYIHRGTRSTKREVAELAAKMEDRGAGEIIVNSIDCDGLMQGYDLTLIEKVVKSVSCPVTALGGAGSLDHVRALYERFGLIGAACGSLFVFNGRYRAVLINYPENKQKQALFSMIDGLAS